MVLNKKKNMKELVILFFTLFCLSAHAQTTIDQIDFYYDESGAIVEAVASTTYISDEESLSKKRQAEIANQQQNADRHLNIVRKGGKDIALIRLGKLKEEQPCSLTISSLPGIQIASKELSVEDATFDLSQLAKGTYIITLSFGNNTESRKINIR